jgi:hypothetical protein
MPPKVQSKTIDILDDCLGAVYRARKNNLRAKQLKFERFTEKRRDKNMSRQRPRTPNPNIDYDESYGLDGEEDSSFLDSFTDSMTLISDAPAPKGMEGVDRRSQTERVQQAQSKQKMTVSFTPMEGSENDNEAAKVFDSFRKEVQQWWNKNSVDRKNLDSRGVFSDYLTDSYLCKQLDPLPPSRVVSTVRKQMSTLIESLASDMSLPSTWGDSLFDLEAEFLPGSDSQLKETQALAAETGTAKNYSSPATGNRRAQRPTSLADAQAAAAAPPNTAVARREAEKKKMSEQYESYMRSKAGKDKALSEKTEKEYESHLDDIRSLLGTISQTPALDA